MAQSDRERLLARALELPQASEADFHGGRAAPRHVDPKLLKRIDDTSLRTKLVSVGLAEGLQSPKGPQKIASILRIYPAFDAPGRTPTNGRPKGRPRNPGDTAARSPRKLPSVDELEQLLRRYREVEHEVAQHLGAQLDERIVELKGSLARARRRAPRDGVRGTRPSAAKQTRVTCPDRRGDVRAHRCGRNVSRTPVSSAARTLSDVSTVRRTSLLP